MNSGADSDTPLERSGFAMLPAAAQVTEFLGGLARRHDPVASFEAGRSGDGTPITAVLLSDDPDFRHGRRAAVGRPTIMMVGSLHGDEPAGCEALLMAVRDIARGSIPGLPRGADILCVPLANPDGRDRAQRGNAAGVNLNIDFLLQSQPETTALTRLLQAFRPHVLLDLHETPAFKKGLAEAGFLSGLDCQIDVPNNPNIDPAQRDFAEGALLPRLLRRIEDKGLRATRYYGEVNRLDKVATHGGLTLRNLRNYAALGGTVAVLAENRLDPPDGRYPTPGNIRQRCDRHYRTILAFLEEGLQAGASLPAVAEEARREAVRAAPGDRFVLASEYAADPERPTVALPLCPLDGGEVVLRPFAYRPRVVPTLTIERPAGWCLLAPHEELAALLDRHALAARPLDRGERVAATVATRQGDAPEGLIGTACELRLEPGDLIAGTAQPGAALLALLLDPRSPHCVFREPPYAALMDRAGRPAAARLDTLPAGPRP